MLPMIVWALINYHVLTCGHGETHENKENDRYDETETGDQDPDFPRLGCPFDIDSGSVCRSQGPV